MRETLIHSACETAFVTFWVMSAYLIFEFSMLFSGTNEAELAKYGDGVIAVVVASFIGLIPGCGPQIIVTSIYLMGIIPLSAQIGNALSNDGDALFPVLAIAPKVGLIATLYSAVPALVISYGYLFIFEL